MTLPPADPPAAPGVTMCFWTTGCSDSKRCREFGQCVAAWQSANKDKLFSYKQASHGVTKEVEAELPPSVRDAVVYLAAASYDAGKHGATDSSSVRDASNELGFAIASAIIAASRAENAALAKLVDEAITWHDEPLNGNALDWYDRARALRAGQQKG